MRIQKGDARLILALGRHIVAYEFDQLERETAEIPGIGHGRDNITLVAFLCDRRCIIVYHAANAVYDGEKCVGKLSDPHGIVPPSVERRLRAFRCPGMDDYTIPCPFRCLRFR